MLKLYMARLRRRAYKFPQDFVFFRKLFPLYIGFVFQTWLVCVFELVIHIGKGKK